MKKSFDVWLSKMKSKLKANTDYYLTLKKKLMYIKSKLLDKAYKLVAPCLCPDTLNSFTLVKEMLQVLYQAYRDLHLKATARAKLYKLY